MRINYCGAEDYPGEFALWNANCQRSIRSKPGQRELRECEAALLALPEKRLIHGGLTDDEGGVCAIACYARHKGLDLSKFDPKDENDAVGVAAGMPRLIARKIVDLNDIELETVLDVLYCRRAITPEERYVGVLKWIREQLM